MPLGWYVDCCWNISYYWLIGSVCVQLWPMKPYHWPLHQRSYSTVQGSWVEAGIVKHSIIHGGSEFSLGYKPLESYFSGRTTIIIWELEFIHKWTAAVPTTNHWQPGGKLYLSYTCGWVCPGDQNTNSFALYCTFLWSTLVHGNHWR